MIRVAVVFGGRSAEHEVSCVSAASVIGAIDRQRYEVVPIGIDKDGRWMLVDGPPARDPKADRLPAIEPGMWEPVTLAGAGQPALVRSGGDRIPVDVVFPVLHGPYGEDGTIQGLLEFAGIPYVGAGVLASAVAMDKSVARVLFRAAGLPLTPWLVTSRVEWGEDAEAVEARAEALGVPLFVKPAALGSSVGVSKVKSLADLPAALEEAFAHGRRAVVEAAVEDAREVECAILGNDEPVASVPGEIVPAGEFYDYRSKYLDDRTRLIVPADLSPETVEEVQRMAVAAFQAVDAAGMARVDFLLGPRGLHLNEVNTIPGFTEVSMYPKMWEASGLPYPDLIDRLIHLGLERHGGADV
ncbi:MAG TPA: D-alanine--D-alanine ligase family protein [Actinomycetota bacterium]